MSVQDNQVLTFDNSRDLLTVLQNLLSLLGTSDYSSVDLGAFGGRTLTDTTSLLDLLAQFESQYDVNFSGALGSIAASAAASVNDANTGLIAVQPGNSSSTLNVLGSQPKLVINTHQRNLLLLQSGGAALAPGEVGVLLNTGTPDAYSVFALGNIYGDTLPQVSQNSGDYTWASTDRNLFWGLSSTADGTVTMEAASLWQPGVVNRISNVSSSYYLRVKAAGADLFDGDTTACLIPPRGNLVISSNGVNSWLVHSRVSPEFTREIPSGSHVMTTFERGIHWGSASTATRTIGLPSVASAFADGVRHTDIHVIENHSTTHDLRVNPNGAELLHLNSIETIGPGETLRFHLRQDNAAWFISSGKPDVVKTTRRSVVTMTAQVPASTSINVNNAIAQTNHAGDTSHNLGSSSAIFQAALHTDVRISINGVPENLSYVSSNAISHSDILYVGTKILIETDVDV